MRQGTIATLLIIAGLALGCERPEVTSRQPALEVADAPEEEVERVYDAVGEAAVVVYEDALEPLPDADEDRDGFARDPWIHPLAPEELCNGVDENCTGRDECDRDGDGALDHQDVDPDDPDRGRPEAEEAPAREGP